MTFLVVCAMYFLMPFSWLIVAATKTQGDLYNTFGLWFSPHFNLFANLQQLFMGDHSIFVHWLLNTLIYAGIGAGVGTVLASIAGYALAKFIFPGRNFVFSLVLGAVLVPTTALALPLFLLMSKVGLTNTYWSVLLPSMVSPFGVYLSRIYAASSVPDELLEAARIDGAGELRTFATVAMRLMTPALVTIFSSSVICASRRAARSSGENVVFIHGLPWTEAGEPVLLFSIISSLPLDTACPQSSAPVALQEHAANQQWNRRDQ